MTAIESIKLSEVFRLVPKPKYVLGTTYTLSLAFFESVVFPFIDRSRLKSCLILCDPIGYHNALTEAAALQSAAQDYLVLPAPSSGSFHPKVWLILGEAEAALIVGSGNLTQAGFMTNAELFDVVHVRDQQLATPALIASLRSFLKGLADLWPADDAQHLLCVDTLLQIEQAAAALPVAVANSPDAARFLHSFQGPLLEQLPLTPDAESLYVAAPYFGNSLTGLNLLASRYSTAALHLFPAVHGGNATNISVPQVRKVHKGARIHQLAVPTKKAAFAHLKLYGAATPTAGWLCCASANCTEAAWQARNVEAALLRPVPPSTVAAYFNPANTPIPDTAADITTRNDALPALQCWATDTGAGVEIVVATDSRKHLPLRDATLTARAGSALATCHKAHLFHDGPLTHIQWAAFTGWEGHRKVAISLEIDATDAAGKPTRAHCLVENRLLLQADPLHRSAWRGALALLDAEGAPELADIAAIFSLANDVFEGNLLKPKTSVPADAPEPVKVAEDQVPPSLAVWPPQPDIPELRKRIGFTALGQLQWFQYILKTFLHPDPAASQAATTSAATLNHAQDDEEDYGEEQPCSEVPAVPPKTAKRFWDRAHDDYSRLREKLAVLCPAPDNAPNIWPASIFAFLSTLAVLRAAKRLAPDLALGSSPDLLCDDFLRAMFNPRRQDEDYCCPKGHRYYRYDPSGSKFPPLAEDLQHNLHIRPHADLAMVLLALIVDSTLRNPAPNPIWQRRYLGIICESPARPDAATRDACRRVWRKYICDPSRKDTDDDFDRMLDRIFTPAPGAQKL